jgi:hypothetical protein
MGLLWGGTKDDKYHAACVKYNQEDESDRMSLIAQLLADEWEPIEGQVVAMKRVVR